MLWSRGGGLGQLSGQGSRASPNGCPSNTAAGLCQRLGDVSNTAHQSSVHGYCSPVFSPWLLSSLLSVVTALQSSLHGYCSPAFSSWLLSSLLSMVTLQSSLHGCCSPAFSLWLLSSLLSMVTLQPSLHGYCSVFSPWLLSSLLSMVTLQSSLHGYCSVFSPWIFSSLLSVFAFLQSLAYVVAFQCSVYCCCCPKRLTFVHLQAIATIVSETEPLIPPERPKPPEPASISNQRSSNTDYEKEARSCPVETADVCPKEVLKSRVFWTLWVMMIVSELGTSFVVSLFKVSAALDVSVALFCVYPPPPTLQPRPSPNPLPSPRPSLRPPRHFFVAVLFPLLCNSSSF